MKVMVVNALYKQVKFYRSPQELNHVMGYAFFRIGHNGETIQEAGRETSSHKKDN